MFNFFVSVSMCCGLSVDLLDLVLLSQYVKVSPLKVFAIILWSNVECGNLDIFEKVEEVRWVKNYLGQGLKPYTLAQHCATVQCDFLVLVTLKESRSSKIKRNAKVRNGIYLNVDQMINFTNNILKIPAGKINEFIHKMK